MTKKIDYVEGVNYETAGLHTLAMYGPLEAFLEKYDKSKLNEQNRYGFSLLHEALYGHKWDIVEFLINEGIDVNLKDSGGNTALHYLCNSGCTKGLDDFKMQINLIKKLLELGCSVNEPDNEKNTPLINATAKSNGPGFERYKLLLEYSPDIYWKNKYGRSCLVLAEETRDFFEDPTIYNYLVEKGLVRE